MSTKRDATVQAKRIKASQSKTTNISDQNASVNKASTYEWDAEKSGAGAFQRNHYILSLFYFIAFFAVGSFQLLNLFYQDIGFSKGDIALLFAMGPLMMIIGQPFWGFVSDKWDAPKIVLVSLLSGSALIALCFLFTTNYSVFIILNMFYWFFQSAINPIIDSTALKLINDKDRYGNVRMWGSLGYAIGVLSIGWLTDQLGLPTMFGVHAGFLVLALLIALRLPIKQGKRIKFNWREATGLFKSPPYVAFLVFNFLLGLTVSANNSFYSIYLKGFGVGLTMVGFALLLKSILEVPFFATSKLLLNRFSFRMLFTLAAVTYAIRFLIMGVSTSPFILILSQILLSLSFSVRSFASVLYVDRIMPDRYKSTGQTLYWATSFGLSGVVGNLLASWYLNHFTITQMYHWITGIALLAGIIVWFSTEREEADRKSEAS